MKARFSGPMIGSGWGIGRSLTEKTGPAPIEKRSESFYSGVIIWVVIPLTSQKSFQSRSQGGTEE